MSVHGTKRPSSGIALGPNFSRGRCASSLVRPLGEVASAVLADGGDMFSTDGVGIIPSLFAWGTPCIPSRAFSYKSHCRPAKRRRECHGFPSRRLGWLLFPIRLAGT